MKTIKQSDVPLDRITSPKGNFALGRQHISRALSDQDTSPGRPPFDIELATLPPGKKNYPLHAHAAQTEHFIILSGQGTLIDKEDTKINVHAGDHFICLPGDAHQLFNQGTDDLVYYVIADNPIADITTYPKTGKRMLKPSDECIYTRTADYYDGEE